VFLSKALDIYDAQKRHSDIRPARARTLWYLGKVLEEAGSLDRASEVRAEAAVLSDEVEVYKDPAQTDPSKRFDELVFSSIGDLFSAAGTSARKRFNTFRYREILFLRVGCVEVALC